MPQGDHVASVTPSDWTAPPAPIYAVMSPKKSYWHTVPGVLTAIAGVVTALTGLIVALQQTGIVGRDQKRVVSDETQDVRVLVVQMQDLKEQIAIERRRLEALNEKLDRQPGASRNPEFVGIAERIGALDSASGTPSAEVGRILLDPSLDDAEKVTLASLEIMKDLDRDIDRGTRAIAEMPPGSDRDAEVMRLKRMIDKRAQGFDMLRAIIDKYNQAAKDIINSMGR